MYSPVLIERHRSLIIIWNISDLLWWATSGRLYIGVEIPNERPESFSTREFVELLKFLNFRFLVRSGILGAQSANLYPDWLGKI